MTDSITGKTWWVIGASEGLGRELTQRLSAAGAQVIASARSYGRLQQLEELPGVRAFALDVTDVNSFTDAAIDLSAVDGVLYCAGAYDPMTAQRWEANTVEWMAQVNFNGALRALGVALPGMVERDQGHVVLVGSLAGFCGLPGAIGYGSSKAALMHLGECLRADLNGSGVKVQVVNPGFIDTRLTQKNDFAMPQLMSAEEAADHVMRAMCSSRFNTSFPIPFAWFFRLGQCLPVSWFQALLPKR